MIVVSPLTTKGAFQDDSQLDRRVQTKLKKNERVRSSSTPNESVYLRYLLYPRTA